MSQFLGSTASFNSTSQIGYQREMSLELLQGIRQISARLNEFGGLNFPVTWKPFEFSWIEIITP